MSDAMAKIFAKKMFFKFLVKSSEANLSHVPISDLAIKTKSMRKFIR